MSEINDRIVKLNDTIKLDITKLESLQDQKLSLEEEADQLSDQINEIKTKLDMVKAKNDEKDGEVHRLKKEMSRVSKEIEARSKGVTQKVRYLLPCWFSVVTFNQLFYRKLKLKSF